MTKNGLIALLTGTVLFLTLAVLAGAKEPKKTTAKEDRLTGTIEMINKDTSTITLRKGNIKRFVVYNADTKYTKVNKPGTMEDAKEKKRVICLGKFDDKARLVATRIDVRD